MSFKLKINVTKTFAMRKKITLVFVPFLILLTLFVLVYSLLHWLVILMTPPNTTHYKIIHIFLSLLLSGAVVGLWWGPKLHEYFDIGGGSDERYSGFIYFLVIGTMTVTNFFAQDYLIPITGKITHLDNINQINIQSKTMYYTLDESLIDRKNSSTDKAEFVSTEIKNVGLNTRFNIVFPIFKPIKDTYEKRGLATAFCGFQFDKTFNTPATKEKEQRRFDQFIRGGLFESEVYDFKKVKYFQYMHLDKKDNKPYTNAIISNPKYDSTKPIILLMPFDQPFKDRTKTKSKLFFGSYFVGLLAFMLSLAPVKLKRKFW
jgi:hypothetical protein